MDSAILARLLETERRTFENAGWLSRKPSSWGLDRCTLVYGKSKSQLKFQSAWTEAAASWPNPGKLRKPFPAHSIMAVLFQEHVFNSGRMQQRLHIDIVFACLESWADRAVDQEVDGRVEHHQGAGYKVDLKLAKEVKVSYFPAQKMFDNSNVLYMPCRRVARGCIGHCARRRR